MEWKDIIGYEGLYQINTNGEVRALGKYINNNGTKVWREGRSISVNKIASGYWVFHVSKDNKRKTIYLHKCLAEAFIDNPSDLDEVHHKDHDKDNNDLNNLEWVTHQENMDKYFEFSGTRKPDNYCSCGAPIRKESTKCISCNKKVSKSPPKEQLLEDRAVMSLEKMATKYEVSRATITRWLKK